ncbi:hypothetical protein QVD17_37973 [Tagetes erecta]|uniref:Uncharacterized protein n=1 Tax=Tagetes erecta TaxID=13708 RepID=A0AAD8NJ07_TARER|nr:hypothetical protein QVD17_37973 [Tagetes erecta]
MILLSDGKYWASPEALFTSTESHTSSYFNVMAFILSAPADVEGPADLLALNASSCLLLALQYICSYQTSEQISLVVPSNDGIGYKSELFALAEEASRCFLFLE